MEYVVELVKALAWPMTVLYLMILFRREVCSVLGRLSHIKYKELEATFEKGLDEVERIVHKEVSFTPPEEISETEVSKTEVAARLNRLVEISPRAAITEAWIEVESAVADVAKQLNISEEKRIPKHKIVQQFQQRGLISEEVLLTFNRLRELRDEAVHAPEFALSALETARYVNLAKGLAAFIRFKTRISAH